jgi:hypothetical protein
MINRNFIKRLERLENLAIAAGASDDCRMVFVNGGSLRPACVIGPDGRYVWWKPPEGFKAGELIEDRDTPEAPAMIIIGFADGDGGEGPTTVIGPDGRLVWLEPPEGCQEGEPIEDTANDPELTDEAEYP